MYEVITNIVVYGSHFIGEELQCDRETANPHDPYAVS